MTLTLSKLSQISFLRHNFKVLFGAFLISTFHLHMEKLETWFTVHLQFEADFDFKATR